MSIAVKTIFNSANQKSTVINVDGQEYASHSIKNPEVLVKILELSMTLTPHERSSVLPELLMMW